MRYYKFEQSRDENIIGHYSQTVNYSYPMSIYEPPYNGDFTKGIFLDFDPDVNIILHKKSKFTDIIENDLGFGLIVNQRVRKVLEDFNIPPHKYHPIKITRAKEVVHNYLWLHYFDDIYKYLDYPKSTIEVYNEKDPSEFEIINIESELQVMSINKRLKYPTGLRLKECYLKSDFPEYDIFSIGIKTGSSIMSEKLVNCFKEKDVTGLEYFELDKLKFKLSFSE